ncbi:hypothetical protein FOZ63_012903 [Perkinsus olseni]|uniref:Uncharacterized protein n=1 Tax=Perkinsus olseni TaxID=32597 RepID=A0A7J6S2H4_PEROL|nr:hypothetical protein FOZ63_012903 [Perkinsus olseni]
MPNDTHRSAPCANELTTVNNSKISSSPRRNSYDLNTGPSRLGSIRTSTTPFANHGEVRGEHVPLTIQSLIRSAAAVDDLDDDSLYAVCKAAVQHGRPRSHANAIASMTRSRSTRGRLSYEELHHLMAATISGAELCDFIPGSTSTSAHSSSPSSASRSRRAQKVIVNFCPMPKMHYFYNALALPEVSQNYYDDIYLRPNACLINPPVSHSSPRSAHHQHRHRDASSSSSKNHDYCATGTSTSSSVGRRLSTVKGNEGVTPSPPAGLPEGTSVQEATPSPPMPDAMINREPSIDKGSGSPRSTAPAAGSSSTGATPQ